VTAAPPERPLPWLEAAVFGLAAVGFLLVAPGGPGWGAASANAVVAAQLDRTDAAPLYGVLANVAACVPIGEPGFRLAALNAVLAAAVLAGVVAATRALVPKLPVAGVVGALLLAIAPPLHDATGPGLLAAWGTVWAVAIALRLRTSGRGDARAVVTAIACADVALGSEPWLGIMMLVMLLVWFAQLGARRDVLALALATTGVLAVALWIGALGSLPGVEPDLGAVLATSGRGAGAIVVGAGLLGAAFAAVTGLPGARGLLAFILIAGSHAVMTAGEARGTPMLALLAVGATLIPLAIVRAAAPDATGLRALAVTAAAGIPLAAVALVAGTPELDPARARGDAPMRVVHALIGDLPPGPGVMLATRDTSSIPLAYAHALAGARPDLVLVPPMPADKADVVAVTALRTHKIAGADVPALGRLDITLARPRGRGFELLLAAPTAAADIPRAPAAYGGGAGERESIAEALERARFEASTGRLDQAARAVGLADRFHAADLALLATAHLGADRPALYDFVPALGLPGGDWQLDLFGDDLAWVAGLPQPDVAPTAAAPRRLHALWRAVLAGKLPVDDARIAQLGVDAVRATQKMMAVVRPTR
jgi:hypothetical protein